MWRGRRRCRTTGAWNPPTPRPPPRSSPSPDRSSKRSRPTTSTAWPPRSTDDASLSALLPRGLSEWHGPAEIVRRVRPLVRRRRRVRGRRRVGRTGRLPAPAALAGAAARRPVRRRDHGRRATRLRRHRGHRPDPQHVAAVLGLLPGARRCPTTGACSHHIGTPRSPHSTPKGTRSHDRFRQPDSPRRFRRQGARVRQSRCGCAGEHPDRATSSASRRCARAKSTHVPHQGRHQHRNARLRRHDLRARRAVGRGVARGVHQPGRPVLRMPRVRKTRNMQDAAWVPNAEVAGVPSVFEYTKAAHWSSTTDVHARRRQRQRCTAK